MKVKHIGLKVEAQIYDKLKYIVGYDQPSLNGLMVHMIQMCIRSYEKEHEAIEPHLESDSVKEGKRSLSITLDEPLLNKFRYVAKHNKRSMSQQIAYLIDQTIDNFEASVEKIELDKKD